MCQNKNICLHKAAHLLSPNAAIFCALPFLTTLRDCSIPFLQPGVQTSLELAYIWVHLWIATSSHHWPPIRDLISSDRILTSPTPPWLLILGNEIIQWTLERCEDCNAAAWPRRRVGSLVDFIWPLWCKQSKRSRPFHGGDGQLGVRQSRGCGCGGSIRHQFSILTSRNQSSPSPAEARVPPHTTVPHRV